MATKKTKGLGRGLDALLIPEPAAADPAGVPMLLPLEEISPGQYQPCTRCCAARPALRPPRCKPNTASA
mgnify:CR=1 FL=1